MYKIIQSPHEILRAATVPVPENLPDLKKIIEEMRATLLAQKNPEGVGLAANQVGLPYKLFLTRFDPKTSEVRVFINPQILEHSKDFQKEKKNSPLEGCLSIPKLYGNVQRWAWVKLKYQIIRRSENSESQKNQKAGRPDFSDSPALRSSEFSEFSEITETFENFPAVVIQHEMDNLDGKIFTQHILEQKGKLYKITGKDKEGKEIWESVKI